MSIIKPVEKVIKRIPTDHLETFKKDLDERRSKLIKLDKEGKVAEEKQNFQQKLSKLFTKSSPDDFTYYVVQPNVKSDLIITTCSIDDALSKRRLELRISYQISCYPGNEESLAEALHWSGSPRQKLDQLIRDWVDDYERRLQNQKTSLIDHFFVKEIDLQNYLEKCLRDEVYLESVVRVRPVAKKGAPQRTTLDSKYFTARFKDFDYDVKVKFKADLRLSSAKKIYAYTRAVTEAELERLLQQMVRTYLEKSTISDFLQIINTDTPSPLIETLNKKLERYGRGMSKIKIKPEADFLNLTQRGMEEEKLEYKLRNKITAEEITLRYIYRAKPIQGREPDIIKGLFNGDPQKNLNQFLRNQTKKFQEFKEDQKVNLIEQFYNLSRPLVAQLEELAEKKLGLKLNLEIKLLGEYSIEAKSIAVTSFFSRLSNHQEALEFSFDGEFAPDPSNRIKAISRAWNPASVEALLIKSIKEYLQEKVDLNSLHYDLNKVNQGLIPHLEPLIKVFGRKTSYARLVVKSKLSVVEQENHSVTIECLIKDYDQPIKVKNNLILKLDDLALFQSRDIPDLGKWIQDTLEQIVQPELFSRTYVEVLTAIGEIEFNVKEEINRRVKEIGYTIDHHIVAPNLKHLYLRTEGFKILEDRDLSTRDSRVKVKLQLNIRGEVVDLSKLSRYLNINPDTVIVDKIRDAAVEVVEEIMYEATPERFYMRYEFTDIPGEIPLRQEIIESIRRRLLSFDRNKTFGLNSDLRVIISPLETGIVKRLTELQVKRQKVELKTVSLIDMGDGESVFFHVPFSIRSVDEMGWYIFQVKSSSLTLEEQIEDIKTVLQDVLMRRLQSLDQELLQYDNFKTLDQLQKRLVKRL
ncbi:MAG: hypothetical protein AAFP19_21475 [Bacteroidota bacterium]